MSLKDKVVLVTGANRGIGAALVRALLAAGVARVHAAARDPLQLPEFGDARVSPLRLDVTDPAQIAEAARLTPDLLINNAGTAGFGDWLSGMPETAARDMAVNYLGTLAVTQAFLPAMRARGAGAIANVISVVGLAPVPALSSYSASKAALQSATQALRGSLKGSGVTVHGIYPGPIDTDLARDIPLSKVSAEHCATEIVKGLEAGETHIFPDPMSAQLKPLWLAQGPALEAALAG